MKLPSWMHRKFRQNSSDVFTGPIWNCLSGGPSLDDFCQLSPVLPERAHGRPMRDRHLSAAADETLLLEGLLSIGTLGGLGPIEEEATTAKEAEAEQEAELIQKPLAIITVVQAIAEKEEGEAATETDLILVNTELEKVLTEAAEREEDGCRLSSARPSHVSGGGKANEVCPLQEYLLGSAVDGVSAEKERREFKRASLGELFMIEEGVARGKGEATAKTKKEEEVKGMNVMKKLLLKKSGPHGNSERAAATADGGAPVAATKDAADRTARFQKILQIFQRKIHAENDVLSRKPTKSSKHKCKRGTSSNGNNCLVGSRSNSLMSTPSERTNRKGKKCSLDQPSLSLGSGSSISREHWIKTDAEYLVLEL